MNILITNDDGIFCPAILALIDAAKGFGEITVVAPVAQQSACGHGMTLHDVLEVEKVNIIDGIKAAYSVSGKPADCVKLAWRKLLDSQPDLVLSGINPGANIGINSLYSGTVAGAAEAVILGAPAIAFSIEITDREPDLKRASAWSREILKSLLGAGQPDGRWFCNVNFPDGCNCQPTGIRVCPQSDCSVWESYRQLPDSNGRKCFKITSDYGFKNPAKGTDADLIAQKYITVSPMGVNLTNAGNFPALEGIQWPKVMTGGDLE